MKHCPQSYQPSRWGSKRHADCVVDSFTSFFSASLTRFPAHVSTSMSFGPVFTALYKTSYGCLLNMQPVISPRSAAGTTALCQPPAKLPLSNICLQETQKGTSLSLSPLTRSCVLNMLLECSRCVSARARLTFNTGQTLTSSPQRLPQ